MINPSLTTFSLCIAIITVFSCIASADIKPNSLFSDNTVIQRDTKVPVWGTADSGEKITVKFRNQTVSTTAKSGKWMLSLKPMSAGGPFTMTINGKNTIQINNVYVGDVWIASGQSNMELKLKYTVGGKEALASSTDPFIHITNIPRVTSNTPKEDAGVNWLTASPKNLQDVTGVGYYFARNLRKHLNVPIGLINTSLGGSIIQTWISKRVLDSSKDFTSRYAPPADWVSDFNHPSVLFNAMIAPLVPYSIKGVIWYQGESNAVEANIYKSLLPAMIKNWRDDWKQGDFPFLLVQLAPFTTISHNPEESSWAELREAQLLTSKTVPNTAMAVITDVGDEEDIHPTRKEPVGNRLALAARAIAYGEKIEYIGPSYKSMVIKDSRVIISFDHAEGGLVKKGDTLTGFSISGEDRKFYSANATIIGNKVVVSCDKVTEPIAVRFGWANYPVVNLFNQTGLPASPFRTDDFPTFSIPI